MDENTRTAKQGTVADHVEIGEDVPKPMRGLVGWYRRRRGHFVWNGAFALLGIVLATAASEAYDRWKPWKESNDDFVGQIMDAQKKQFESLDASLKQIRGTLPSEGRDAFRNLQQSLTSLERNSSGLVQQLDLARKEVASLRAIADGRGGLGSGYDFTLSSNGGMDLAPGAVIGLTSVGPSGARVNLTSGGQTVYNDGYVRSGQSLSYTGTNGSQCWVSLMSLQQGNPGAASFKVGCNS